MVETLGIVDVGCASIATEDESLPSQSASGSRPSGSLIRRRFGGKSLLEWVVRRVSDSLQLDQIAVLVRDSAQYAEVAKIAPSGTPVYMGSQKDELGRLVSALREFQARSCILVSLNDPFVDPVLIDRLVCTARAQNSCDYVGYCRNEGQSAVQSYLGFCAEWCRAEALERAERDARMGCDRRELTRYILTHPEHFQLRFVPLPRKLDRDDLRLTLRVEEDWEHAHMIFDALGPESLDWQRIAGLLDHHPAIRERMAILNGLACSPV